MYKIKVIYDDCCNLCVAAVKRIKKKDAKGTFIFVPFHTSNLHVNNECNGMQFDQLIVVKNNQSIKGAQAVLMIMKELGGFVALVSFCIQKLPNIFLDKLYFLLATNRYRIWGKRKECSTCNGTIIN